MRRLTSEGASWVAPEQDATGMPPWWTSGSRCDNWPWFLRPDRPHRKTSGDCFAETPRTVSTASGPVEYAERGEGEPILSIHGTLGGWDQGLVAGEYLRVNGFRIIAPSRPGYLGTPLSTGRTFAQQGDALAALLDVLEIDRIIVFALSGGGPAGYELAVEAPRPCGETRSSGRACAFPARFPRQRHSFSRATLSPGRRSGC